MVAQKEKDYNARNLYQMFKEESNRVLLMFIYPILKELRRITKLLQTKTADNMKVFSEMKALFLDLARKILRKSTVENNSAEHLCKITLESKNDGFSPPMCLLKVEEMQFGQTFLQGKSIKLKII